MSTKTTKRKPTQLDRIEAELIHIKDRLAKQYGFYSGLRDKHFPELQKSLDHIRAKIDTLNAFETLQEALSDHGKKEPEDEPLRVGDWVVVKPIGQRKPNSLGSSADFGPNPIQVLRINPHYHEGPVVDLVERPDGCFISTLAANVRRLSAEEIDAHLKAEEERKPIDFGARVRFNDFGPFSDAPCEYAFYMGKIGDKHQVVYKHDNDPAQLCTYRCQRSEFTVVNPS